MKKNEQDTPPAAAPAASQPEPSAEELATRRVLAAKRAHARRWSGWPDNSPTVMLPNGQRLVSGGEIKV